jgi:two-component system, chemotaxis family, chemotaxis protein CheY
VNEFLAKPVSVKAVMVRLTSVIEHPRAFVRTKVYFGPCRRRRGKEEYRGPERRAESENDATGEDLRAAS